MSESKTEPPRPFASEEIGSQDIVDFLNEKQKVHNCPSCLENNWDFLLDKDIDFGLSGMHKSGGFRMPPPFIPAINTICLNCGHIKSYAKAIIGKWIQEKRNKL